MPRSRKPSGPTPVEAIVHPDKRANLPTADAHDLVTPDVQDPVPVTYPRELRSPMLAWQGKEALDEADLEVDAPPIYIQEKIDPRVVIGLYAFEWGVRVRRRGGFGRVGQVTPPAWRSTRSR